MYENIAMVKNLSSAIKNEKLDERLKTSITEQTSLNDIFLSLKNKKLHSYEIRSQLRWINYKTNFVIFKMIRPHMMLSGK